MIKKMYLFLVICFLAFVVLACSDDKKDDEENEVKEYIITFVVDDSEETVTVKEGEKVSKPADPVKDGYEFIGWYQAGTLYDFGVVTSDITVIAKFEEIVYIVKFVVNGNETVQTIKEGEKAIKPQDPVKEGYNFIGWYVGDDAYDFEASITSDLELIAKFEEIVYTVKFVVDSNETVQTIKEGEKAIKPQYPAKEGYNFLGWYVGDDAYDFEAVVTSDLEITAKFELIIPKAILTEEIEMYIKQACCSYWGNGKSKPEDYRIKDYLGKYGDAYCAIILGNRSPLISVLQYTVILEGKEFIFNFVPEYISIYYNNTYYHIGEACELGIINIDDMEYIYAYFYKYCDNYIDYACE